MILPNDVGFLKKRAYLNKYRGIITIVIIFGFFSSALFIVMAAPDFLDPLGFPSRVFSGKIPLKELSIDAVLGLIFSWILLFILIILLPIIAYSGFRNEARYLEIIKRMGGNFD